MLRSTPRHLAWLLPLVASACSPWTNLPDQSDWYFEGELWDVDGPVASRAGLYVPLPLSGGLALVRHTDGGSYDAVDLGEGRLSFLTVAPDGDTVVAFVDRYRCLYDGDNNAPETVDECSSDDLAIESELNVIADGSVVNAVPMDGTFNAIEYSEDGRFAVAYLDFSKPDLSLNGVINLTGVVVLNLETQQSTPVSVGFAADQVLFVNRTDPSTGEPVAERAVVLSQNQVAVVDLTLDVPERVLTFPLTLDPDSTVTPVGVQLTPDGRYAMISVEGRADLYVLDLDNASINIVELSGNPSDLAVNEALDRTVLVYGNRSTVDVLEHDFFEIDSFDLDEPMTDLWTGSDFSMLYNTDAGHDAYKLNLETLQLTEYRLQNPAVQLSVSPNEQFAIALTRAEPGNSSGVEEIYDNNPGMEVLELGDDKTTPFLLEGMGVGVAWTETEATLHALVLQSGIDYLYQLDMYTGRPEELTLDQPALGIGAIPDGPFYITHQSTLGQVTFLDPISGQRTEVAGFGTLGLFDEIQLLDEEN